MTMANSTSSQKQEHTERPMTINCNDKGGMDTVEFGKYLKELICPLYKDAADIPKYIIVDSGPSRCNTPTVMWLYARGFYLLPSVPNTTHLTQVTD